jgi:soluble lytic murein transglycosylase-like protein
VHSVIRAESNYNTRAISPKGAQGIMQLIPSTARRFGVSNAFDPQENVRGGVKYLKFLLDYYQNDYVRAIAAYNAGEAAVDKYHGVPPFEETRNYVYAVARNLKTVREKRIAQPASAPEAVPVETYKRIEASVGSDGRVYFRTP